MSEEKSETQEKNGDDGGDHGTTGRVFLVVVDESQEMQKALRFACRRSGGVGFLDSQILDIQIFGLPVSLKWT